MRLKSYRLKLILLLISCMLFLLYNLLKHHRVKHKNEFEISTTAEELSNQHTYMIEENPDPSLLQSIYDPLSNQTNQSKFEQQLVELSREYEKAAERLLERKLWFFQMKKNLVIKANVSQLPLFPKESPYSDRIVNQLIYVPPGYEQSMKPKNYKTIYLVDGPLNSNEKELGSRYFEHCPVSTCTITNNSSADLLVYRGSEPTLSRNKNQLRMIFALESPLHSFIPSGTFDWTATYRRDSDIVAPYGKWEYYNPHIKQQKQSINYAKNKTKQVAWFVSNCMSANNRLEVAHELHQYIGVDIYGACGSLTCFRSSDNECFQLLQNNYKFYLSFENSNCRDYVTEKFFLNALENNVIPIVMGGSKEDYQLVAPEKSFIHVDEFQSVKHLADYLKLLDADDVLYNSYFQWKGTGEFLNTHFWCRVCALLHVPNKNPKLFSLSDTNFHDWWKGKDVCMIQEEKSTHNESIPFLDYFINS